MKEQSNWLIGWTKKQDSTRAHLNDYVVVTERGCCNCFLVGVFAVYDTEKAMQRVGKTIREN
jgi:hypothetical protein